MTIKVPKKVYEGLEAVRASGVTNMLDRARVQYYAHEWGHWETVIWLEDNRTLYMRGVLKGIEPEEAP